MSIAKEGKFEYVKIYFSNFNLKTCLGFLKVKLHHQVKWHRRYCTVDWDKSILFIASKADTRYRDWIKLLPNTVINDYEYSSASEANNSLLNNIIEIKAESMKILFRKLNISHFFLDGTETHLLQIETKKDYDSWIVALKRTAFSRIGGGKLVIIRINNFYRLDSFLITYQMY